MANSDLLDIWRDALGNIGSKTSIASTTEQSAEAAACAVRYGGIVQKIIRETDWNCLRTRTALTEAPTGAVWPPSWTFMWLYPADCFCVRGFDMGWADGNFRPYCHIEYEVSNDATTGRVILTNEPDPTMVYTAYALDLVDAAYEAKFDASLRDAVGWALAAAIAGPLTGSASFATTAKNEAVRSLAEARAANANESAPNSMDAVPAESLQVRGFGLYDSWRWRGGWR